MGVFPDYEAFCAAAGLGSADRWRPSASPRSCARPSAASARSRPTARPSARSCARSTAAHPDTEGQLFGADGELNRYVNVYLNDEDVRVLDGLDTAVGDGDTVVILPAMAGGALSRLSQPTPADGRLRAAILSEAWLSPPLLNRPCGGRYGDIVAGDRQHAARRAQAPLAQAGRAHLRQARVAATRPARSRTASRGR